MANKKFLNPINLVNLSSDPSTASEGDIYYNTTDDVVKVYSNGSWAPVVAGNPDYITFDTTPETEPTEAGSLWWNPDFETLNVQLDSAVTLQVGQEHVVRVKNDSGSVAIPEMRVVMFAGATGDTVEVTPALSTASYEPELLLGVTTEQIPADGFGFVTQFGFVNKVDTSDWELGDLLYSDPANAGLLTNVKPSAPNWTFPIAAVTRVHASTGMILVRALPGKHLHDLVDVAIDTPADNEVLAYDNASGVWKNQTAEEAGVAAYDHNHTLDSLSNIEITGTPADGQAIVWDISTSKWINETVSGGSGNTVTVGSTAPTSPNIGDGWYDNTDGSYYVYDGTYWVEVNGVIQQTEDINNLIISAYNDSGDTIDAFVPVAFSDNDATNGILIVPADASSSFVMPSIGFTTEQTLDGSPAKVILYGLLSGVDTSTFSIDDPIYVGSGGGLTSVRPTGSGIVQEIGKVVKIGSTDGQVLVYNTGRSTNLPNLSEGNIWLGNVTSFPTQTTLDTSNVPENGSLYFTDERARSALSADLGGSNGGIRIIAPSNTADATLSNDSATHQVIVRPSGNGTDVKGTLSVIASPSISDPGNLTVDGYIDSAGSITGSSIIKDGGASSEFLKADGSVDTNTYLTTSDAFSTYQPIGSYASDTHNHTLDSLSNVVITGTPADGEALVWDTITSKWVNETVTQDLSAYAPIVDPVFTNNIEVKQKIQFDIVSGTPLASISKFSGPGYDAFDIYSSQEMYIRSDSGMAITSQENLVISGLSGEYLNSVGANNQIATIGDLTLEKVTDGGATSTNAISITNATASSSPITGALIVTGGVGIGEDLYVDNDVYIGGNINITGSITGDLTSVDVTNLVVTDPLIYLAEGNPDDSVDIGIFAALNHGGPLYKHTGLIRDASDSGKWKLVSNLDDPINNVINFTGANFDTLVVGDLEVNGGDITSSASVVNLFNGLQTINIGNLSDSVPGQQAINIASNRTHPVVNIGNNSAAVGGQINIGGGYITSLVNVTISGDVSFPRGFTVTGQASIDDLYLTNPLSYEYGGTGLSTLGTAGQVLTVNSTEDAVEWTTPSGGGGGPSTTTTSITVNTAVVIESFATATSRTAEAIVQITQGSNYYSSKVLVIHNGTTVKITEYAILESTVGAIPVTISSVINGSDVEIRATITNAATTNATAKVVMTEVEV